MAGHNHGHTLAAWTAVTIIFIGFCIGGAYTVMAQPLGVAAGGAVILLGCVVGLVMRAAGLGQKPQAQVQVQAGAQRQSKAEAPAPAAGPQTQAPASAPAQS